MRHLILLLALALVCTTTAQPTWRFHLAFEDGTGARDTIWFVFDTSATIGTGFGEVDYALGEGAVAMDPDGFNVWILNSALDSTKTIAFPFAGMFPYITAEIQAFNYTYPITLRWDTALFRLPWLPAPGFPYDGGTMDNEYFFFYENNDPWGHSFILGWSDSVVVQPPPEFPDIIVFPLLVNLGLGSTTGTDELRDKAPLHPFPNPGSDGFTIRDAQPIREVQLRSLDGRLCKVQQGQGRQMELNAPELPNGMYLLGILRADGTWRQATWIKAD